MLAYVVMLFVAYRYKTRPQSGPLACLEQQSLVKKLKIDKMASTTASNWQQREEEAVKKLLESLPQWTVRSTTARHSAGTKTRTGVLPENGLTYYWRKMTSRATAWSS